MKGTWKLDYTLQNGLIGTTQSYTESYFDGTVTQEGLRDITGKLNGNGTVTIWGVTSTDDSVTNMDNGAGPNELVSITDTLSDTTLPADESFTTLIAPSLGKVIRGVASAPVPEPASAFALLAGLVRLGVARRRRG